MLANFLTLLSCSSHGCVVFRFMLLTTLLCGHLLLICHWLMHHSGRIIRSIDKWICPLLPTRWFRNLSFNACIYAAALFRIRTMPGRRLFPGVLVGSRGAAVWGRHYFVIIESSCCVCQRLLRMVLLEYLLKPTLASIDCHSILTAAPIASSCSTWRIFRRCDRYGLLLFPIFVTNSITHAGLT